MALKKILNLMKTDSESLVAKIDKFLLKMPDESGEDRGHGMNSPSAVGYCIRSVVYGRMGIRKTSLTPPRLQRIFDNGNYTHDRLQTYLEKMGILKLREVPVWNEELQIMGHSDGLIAMTPMQLSILEIKSINDNGFGKLIEAKPEHVRQAHVYMYCLEELRKQITAHTVVKDRNLLKNKLAKKYEALMDTFVTDGSRFTKEEKIKFKLEYLVKVLDLLAGTAKPINTVILLYENKNNQDLKSFTIKWDEEIIAEIKGLYAFLNICIKEDEIPDRPEGATGKSSTMCRGCDYADKCY